MTTREFHEDEQLKEARWFEEQQRSTDLTPEQLEQAFEVEPGICTCIDEGTDGDIRLAGSGILHPGGLDAVAALLMAQGVTEVTAHEHCGAAAMAYKRDHPTERTIDNDVVDRYAADWGRQLADRLSVPYRYIPQAEMQRPGFHDASVVYVDTVGHFQPQRIGETSDGSRPRKGFVVSAAILSGETVAAEIELATSIALSAAGFGTKFDEEHPFTIVIIGEADPKLQSALQELVKDHQGRVAVTTTSVAREVEAELVG